MIPHTLQITLSIAVICYFILILRYLKKKMLELKYTLIWLVAGVVMGVMIFFPELLVWFVRLLGIESNMNGLYVLCFAFIIAILLFIVFTLCRLPYASLIGVLAGVLSFIPYIGSWAACAIGALLILIIDPWKALLSVIVYQIVQFLEGQLIYPRVVGSSVGLPPLYTLLAALLGGKLFGIVGVIFFIPLVAVVYVLVKEATNKRLKEKEMEV